jgi:hypothetical protein
MTITQLITELQKLQAEHGDLPLTMPDGVYCSFEDYVGVESIDLIPADTIAPSYGEPFYEVDHIHLRKIWDDPHRSK